jgi:hypothetical protein
MMSDGGKGSGRRKAEVPQSVVDNNWETIFGKKAMTPRVQETNEEFGTCGCGRSPSGKCCGWHGLTEEDYQAALAEYNRQRDSE